MATSLGMELHGAAQLLKREFERQARQHRMTIQQWKVLKQLSINDGITQSALGALIEASPMTVSDILDRMEGLGHVRRETDPSDSRAKLVWLTSSAGPLLDEMKTVIEAVYARALGGISQADQAVLHRALIRIAENLSEVPADKETTE